MKKFVLRVDIDTVTCVRYLPNLLNYCDELGLKLSIFSTLGKTIDRRAILSKIINRHNNNSSNNNVLAQHDEPTKKLSSASGECEHADNLKLSNIAKMGWFGYLETVFLNPDISVRQIDVLQDALRRGHQVGLHGGRNHGSWLHSSNQEELLAGLLNSVGIFKQHIGSQFAFTSPGYRRIDAAYEILKDEGCRYISDSISDQFQPLKSSNGIVDIPVTISGPNTIDYLENIQARFGSNSDEEVNKRIENILSRGNDCEIYYTHPCYCMGVGKNVFKNFVERIRTSVEPVTMDELVACYES